VFVTVRGDFYRYQRDGPAPVARRTLTFVRRDSAHAIRLVDAAKRHGITRIRFSEPSNMTCHLSLAERDTTYEIAWPMGAAPAVVTRLVAVAEQLSGAVRSR
jgi:hypothetical protein